MTLSAADLSTLASWADHGGKLDEAATTPIKPSKQVQEAAPRKDEVLMMPKAYTGVASIPNDYRCFVLNPKITKPTFLTGYTFLPDQLTEIHHSQVFHISAQQAANAAKLEGQDGRPGWQCYGGVDVPGVSPSWNGTQPKTQDVGFSGQNNLVAGWVPGQLPVIYPDNSGILLMPGDQLVMQLHYHHDGNITPDRSGLALQLTPQAGSNVKKLRIVNPLGSGRDPLRPDAHRSAVRPHRGHEGRRPPLRAAGGVHRERPDAAVRPDTRPSSRPTSTAPWPTRRATSRCR